MFFDSPHESSEFHPVPSFVQGNTIISFGQSFCELLTITQRDLIQSKELLKCHSVIWRGGAISIWWLTCFTDSEGCWARDVMIHVKFNVFHNQRLELRSLNEYATVRNDDLFIQNQARQGRKCAGTKQGWLVPNLSEFNFFTHFFFLYGWILFHPYILFNHILGKTFSALLGHSGLSTHRALIFKW